MSEVRGPLPRKAAMTEFTPQALLPIIPPTAHRLWVAGFGERWDTETVPTALRLGPYRFYFFSHEPKEPPPEPRIQSGRASAHTTDAQGQRKHPDGEMECKFRKLSLEIA